MSIHRIRKIALFLAAVLLVSSLVSCAETPETQTESATGTEIETDAPSVYEKLAKENWGGRTFTILCRDDFRRNFLVEEFGSEGNTLLDDSIYERNRVVSRDLNIVIDPIVGGDYNAVNQTVAAQSTSGTDDYDAIMGQLFTYTSCAVNKYLWNLADVETLDTSAVWWDEECVTNLSAYGYTPLLCGDILPGSMTQTACIVFNKKMMADLGKAEPYDTVKAGKWTLDMLNAVTAGVTSDLNGDGKIKQEDDRFGLAAFRSSSLSFFYGAGDSYIHLDADGIPEVNFDHEKVTEIYDKMYQGLYTQQACFITDGSAKYVETFIDGRALYLDCLLSTLTQLSAAMTDDYGIVPEPKYDEAQETYCSFLNGSTPLVGIVSTESTPEFSGAVLEAMGAYNHVVITPLLFEVVTKYRNARDPESAEMVDVIISHRVFDFAFFYDTDLGWMVYNNLKKGQKSVTSAMKAAEKNTSNSLKNIVRKWSKAD